MLLGDKATTLQKLKIKSAIIPKVLSFKVIDYLNNKDIYLSEIKKSFKQVAIRSSNFAEDSNHSSGAGKFLSILNIDANNKIHVDNNINKVINSYKNYKHKKNRILIQEMVKDIVVSGVATSCVKEDLSPYYVINISKSSDSTIITSGKDTNNETYYVYENCKIKLPNNLNKIKKLIDSLKIKFKEDLLDIEFAINKKGENIFTASKKVDCIKK